MRFLLLAIALTAVLAAAGCSRRGTVRGDRPTGKSSELRFARDAARVRQAAVAALESLLRKSDPPTVLTIREDGDQISSPWYYGLNDVPWRRRTTFHLLSDGDDTILVAYTELERRTPEGWGPESETDEGYRRLGALVSGHIR